MFVHLGSVNIMTNFVLLNAIYFKGNWLRKFDSSLTKVESFYLASKYEIIDVDMMHMDALFRTGYIESVDARMLELPYAVVRNLFSVEKNINILIPKFFWCLGGQVEHVYLTSEQN